MTTVRNLDDNELTDLLEESIKKLESTSEQDSKKLSDMNNTLNWILTFTTVFFIFYTRLSISEEKLFAIKLSDLSKIFFLSLTAILIAHKIFLIKYEDFKGGYLASLRTHYIDLKFNLDKLKPKLIATTPFSTVSFINSFRNGDFLYNYDRDKSIKELRKLDRKIVFYGNGLKLTYSIGMIFFWLNLIVTAYILITVPLGSPLPK